MKRLKILYPDNKMPYLIKDSRRSIGGATVEWYSWIQGLRENNCEVSVLTWKGAKKYVGNNNHGINFIETFDPTKGIKKIRWIYYRFPRLLKAIKKYNPDVIIQECASAETGIMCLLAKILNIPFVYRVANDMDTDERLKTRLNLRERMFFIYGLKNSDAIFCQNSYQYQSLLLKYPNKKLFKLPGPFFYDHNTSVTKRKDRHYMAWVGVFQYQKNLPGLLSIAKKMPEIEFKVVGNTPKDSGLDTESSNAVNELKKCMNVKLIGFLTRENLRIFLSKAIALINTSHYEGFPSSYLDSLAVGTPIITLTKNDPDDFIKNNNVGFVVNDISELHKILKKIINLSEYNALANHCMSYLLENHAAENLSKKFIRYLPLKK